MSEFNNVGTSRIEMDESILNNAKVKVFGVGGAGGNTVNRMVGMNIQGVEYYAVNTDAKALELSLADHKIVIGEKTTKGLGAGMKPEMGRKSAEENIEELKEAMKGADMIFITAGMGGGTGTGAAPIVGSVAREMGILTVAVVTKPFRFEGKRRATLGAEGIKNLRAAVDTMIVVDNEKLMGVVQSKDKAMTLDGAFKLTDEILGNAVRSICGIMFNHGLVHVDFADIRTVMTNGGSALMGTGISEGEDRGIIATDLALSSPLLEDINVEGATGVLVNVCHGENFSMLEYTAAMDHIYEAVGEKGDPNIIMGDIMIPEMGDKVSITIIATGCGGTAPAQPAPMFTAESIHAVQQPALAPQTSVSNLATSLGAPQAAPQVAPQPAPQPVAATPRPTSINFAALAHNTVAMPAVDEVRTAEMNVVTDAPEKAPAAAANYASSRFDATAAAEEELVFTTTASLPETEEMPAVADMDTLSNGDYGTPAYTRQTMALQQSSTKEIRTPKYPEGSLMNNGVDYDMPAFLRMGGNEEF
ncbi:cell division protein FtsZ [Fibrobacter sp.]|uniref:cell division protein FtsZ n=1 Tax=Fibrobacter sp. TaxID=35828 RepID=UPI00388DEC76